MQLIHAAPDPDCEPRAVSLPASWSPMAASALSALAPGHGPASLPQVAARWINAIGRAAAQAGLDTPIVAELQALLLKQRGAPGPEIWADEPGTAPRFTLNLSEFVDDSGFDLAGLLDAVGSAVTALHLIAPAAQQFRLGLTGLAGLLAALGLDYRSSEARRFAASLAYLTRIRADAASSALPGGTATARGYQPEPPDNCVDPAVNAAIHHWRSQLAEPRHVIAVSAFPPGPVDALLGVETGGIAPAFSPLAADGGLSRMSRHWLAARGLSMDRAVAMLLAGQSPFPAIAAQDAAAMRDAVGPFMAEIAPFAVHEDIPAQPASRREPLPARRGGYTQRAVLAGHKVYVRTGEYPDGRLGEVAITAPKDGSVARGLMDALSTAISLGLQHGVRLESFVDLFLNVRFGAAGLVEGDPHVPSATSVLDYAMRHLAACYLGRADLPVPIMEPEDAALADPPLLPMELPRGQRRLRLVGN
jgi:ribonucleoside-diphosphate reductase alpha chain